MNITNPTDGQNQYDTRFKDILSILQSVAVRDFSRRLPDLPETDKFAELFIALNLTIDDLADAAEEDKKSKDQILEHVRMLELKTTVLEDTKQALKGVFDDMQAEQKALAQTKAKNEAILASIGDALVVMGRDGNIVMVNKAFEETLGWREDEVLVKPLTKVIPLLDEDGREVPESERLITKTLKNSTTVSASNFNYKRKDGSIFPVDIITSPIMINKDLLGVVEIFRDITKERQIDKDKSEFVSLASHQLRTPLTAINWYTEMLLAGDAGKLTEKQKSYLDEIYGGSVRMVGLVNDLLNVSRIETGRLKVEPRSMDLGRLIKSTIHELVPMAEQHLCSVVFNEPMVSLANIMIDEILVRQVIHNLITNAIIYSSTEQCDVIVTLIQKGESYIVGVEDSGIGIPEGDRAKVFNKFFRADNARQREAGGSGIGLYIAKMIIENAGGKLWFDSKEGKGTTFYLSLPTSGMEVHKGERGLA